MIHTSSRLDINLLKKKETILLKNTYGDITAGQWTAFLGSSGCGKTTLLRYIAGLCQDTLFEGHIPPYISPSSCIYMAHDPTLLPWKTVHDNIGLSALLKNQVIDTQHILSLLTSLDLDQSISDAFPSTLSAGMQQRVALARALYTNRPIVLLDEPFSALDAVTRRDVHTFACQHLREKTVILVTHDLIEAMSLCSHIYVFHKPSLSLKGPFTINQPPGIPRPLEQIMDEERALYRLLSSLLRPD